MKRFKCFILSVLLVSIILLSACTAESKDTIANITSTSISVDNNVLDSELLISETTKLIEPTLTTTEEIITTITELITELPTTTIEIIENPDFRNTKWGDSPEFVISHESTTFYQESEPRLINNALLYSGTIGGLSSDITYFFDSKQRLYQGMYSITKEHGNSTQLYISNYNDLKKSLIEKYGNPYEDEIYTLNNLASYTDDATALQLGYTMYRSRWKTDTTEIILYMATNNRKIQTVILYESINLIPETDLSDF